MASPAETLAFLREVRLFKDIEAPELTALGLTLRERVLKRGQVLFHEGEIGEEMFIVVRGSIVISKPVKERVEQVLARMGPGDFFGEMSLFDHSPRSATVQADSDATLLVLDREALRRLTELSPRGGGGVLPRAGAGLHRAAARPATWWPR